jgi:hypothetical protein
MKSGAKINPFASSKTILHFAHERLLLLHRGRHPVRAKRGRRASLGPFIRRASPRRTPSLRAEARAMTAEGRMRNSPNLHFECREARHVVQWGMERGGTPLPFFRQTKRTIPICPRPARGGFCDSHFNNQDDAERQVSVGRIGVLFGSGIPSGLQVRTMLALKRLLLVILVLTIPAALTALLYWGTGALLAATNRVIDPEIVRLAAIVEFAAFFFVAVLEAKDRWSAQP